MKKSICIVVLMIGFSAFAFSPKQGSGFHQSATKVSKKKALTHAATPLTDLVAFPF